MNGQIICEGPTDLEILKSIIFRISSNRIKIIEESKTQVKYRGCNSIINNYKIFSKMLHNGFAHRVRIILICVDNDENPINSKGLGYIRKERIEKMVEQFIRDNKKMYNSYLPEVVITIPVETIDYWMRALDFDYKNCKEIRKIVKISKAHIKQITYGEKNVYLGWMIDENALKSQIKKIDNPFSMKQMRCLPSFLDFEMSVNKCIEQFIVLNHS